MAIYRLISLLLVGLLSFSARAEAAVPTEPVSNALRVLLIPEQEAIIASQTSGKIINLPKTVGQSYQQGQTLIEFDCREAKAKLDIVNAERRSSEAMLKSRKQLAHLQSTSELEVALAQAANDKANAQVTLQNFQVENCLIKAPFKGAVVKIRSKLNEVVNPGQVLLEYISQTSVRAQLNLPSIRLSKIPLGSTMTIHIDETNRSYAAKIISFNQRIDAASQTVETTATITDPNHELLPGMSGVANF